MHTALIRRRRGGSAPNPELVTNGTFDSDTSGWTATAGTLVAENGRGKLTHTSSYPTVSRTISDLIEGETHRLSWDWEKENFSDGPTQVWLSDIVGGLPWTDALIQAHGTSGSGSTTFTAPATSGYINWRGGEVTGTGTLYVDNISVKLV